MEQRYLGPSVGLWTGDLTRWVLIQILAALSLLINEAVRRNTSKVVFSEGHQIATARWDRNQSHGQSWEARTISMFLEWARWQCSLSWCWLLPDACEAAAVCQLSKSRKEAEYWEVLGLLCCAVCSGIVFIQTPPKDPEMRETWGYSARIKRHACVSDKERGIGIDRGTISTPCKCYSWGKEVEKRG